MHKKYRLRANADFQNIRRRGRTLFHPLMVIAILPNGLDHCRFGFAVGRRIGKAAKRNQIKRRMREAVRVRNQNKEICAGWDVVLVARSPIVDAPYHEVDSAIVHLLRRARLLREAA